jgi:predicted ATPase
MFLLAQATNGQFARALAQEGGMPSALWAGERAKGVVRMTLGAKLDSFGYELSAGLPVDPDFPLDPEIKEERVWLHGKNGSKITMMERKGPSATLRDLDQKRVRYPLDLSTAESALSQLREPHRYPELAALRDEMSGWRFYHHFRTDPDSPLRQPQLGVRTQVLSHDGRDLAAALRTIQLVGDVATLNETFSRGIPGAALDLDVDEKSLFTVALRTSGLHRKLHARELSDGTLRFLCLLAALLSPRPAALIALNEPETSLHPELIAPLAQLIVQASKSSQFWITTHSSALADAITACSGFPAIQLALQDGETRITNATKLGEVIRAE